MKKMTTYCDHCKKEIKDNYHSRIPIYCNNRIPCEGGF